MANTVKDDMLADLAQRERALKEQLREIRNLKKAIKAVGEKSNEALSTKRNSSHQLSLKEMVVSVLTDRGSGAEALEIIRLIQEKFGREVARTSLSPQLSRLKNEKVLFLNDKIWYLYENRPRIDAIRTNSIQGTLDKAILGKLTLERRREDALKIQKAAELARLQTRHLMTRPKED